MLNAFQTFSLLVLIVAPELGIRTWWLRKRFSTLAQERAAMKWQNRDGKLNPHFLTLILIGLSFGLSEPPNRGHIKT